MRWWIGIAIIIILVILLISINDGGNAPATTTTTTTTTTQTQTADPSQQNTEEPEPTPEAAPQPRRQAQQPVDGKLQALKIVAARNRVQLAGYQRGGAGAKIRIEWIGDSSGPGGDFMMDLLRQGVIRSADNAQQGINVNQQQQRVYWTQWDVAF